MYLTPKEKEMVERIKNSEYENPWTWAVAGDRSSAGVLSSLVKKGVITIQDYEGKGRSDDMYCYFTEIGEEIAAALEYE